MYIPGLQTVFIAREDFLRFTAEENCPFCLKREPASEKHLMQRHYFYAVHFIEDGTGKFLFFIQIKTLPLKAQSAIRNHSP